MKKSILFGIIGLVVGIVASAATASYAVNGNHISMMKIYAIDTNKVVASSTSASMSMAEMNAALTGKTGDAFDKAFISEMIQHHQGAIEMANLARDNAKHDEVKSLAKDIIAAQTTEISRMQQWQSMWGYIPTTSMPGMNM